MSLSSQGVEAVLEQVDAHGRVVEDGEVVRLEAGVEHLAVFVVGHDRDAVRLLLDERLHVEALLEHGDAIGAAIGGQAELVHPGVERILVAEEPDAQRLALEVGFGVLMPVYFGQTSSMPGLGERLGDVDQHGALLARGQRAAHPVDDDIGAAAGNHRLRSDVRAARLDGDVETFVLVEALVLGDVVAAELGLGDPLQLQRHRIGGDRRPGRQRERGGECSQHNFLHVLPLPIVDCTETTDARTLRHAR